MPIQGNKTLPNLLNPSDLIQVVKKWQTSLNPQLGTGRTPIAPYNFRATPQRGGILLQWNSLNSTDADGYQILRSLGDANFSAGSVVAVSPANTNQYADNLGSIQTVYYRIRATNGSSASPQSIIGVLSGIIKATSLDPNDNITPPVTTYDFGTTDRSQSAAGRAKIVQGKNK